MSSVDEIRSVLESFVDDLHDNIEPDTHRFEDLLHGRASLREVDVGSRPEPWTRVHLIRPLLDAVGLEWEPEIHGGGEGYPDFGITNLSVTADLIGEDKRINNVEDAESDVKEYLNNRAASRDAEYGIATDGIEWRIIHIELGGDYLNYSTVRSIDLRQVLLQLARDQGLIEQTGIDEVDVDEQVEAFLEIFGRDNLDQLLTQQAPKEFRDQKREGIQEFYDLYVELLFGEGEGDYDYDTTLLDNIRAPSTATESDQRRFAIRLVNRLLFVKFLEDRGVLPDRFLDQRVEHYQELQEDEDRRMVGSLYKSQLEPMFFNLFNTHKDDRPPSDSGGWFDDVEYLNGSLFDPEEGELEYDVGNRMLIRVVRDLVEGHELEDNGGNGGLDPSVLGNVFEMTINHLGGESDAQKEEGAYYTPSDVIRLITRQAVDPKIYEILVDVYTTQLVENSDLDEDTANGLVSNYELGEILRKIEQREGYFGDPDAMQEAKDRLGTLRVIDPACGSGHFLTGVLDEIHRVRMSLLRGVKGDDLDDEDVYEAKKELVLNAVYGVDINPIAIEIAKLRVWLKMVEEGWKRSYGELPNIDVNIVDGNSLIGLPAKSSGQAKLQAFDVDLDRIQEVRDLYKSGEISRRELSSRIEELRPELRQHYLDRLNHYFEERIESRSDWEAITEGFNDIYPTVRKLTVRRADDEEFSEDQEAELVDVGFKVEPRYGKSAKVEEETIDEIDEVGALLDDGLVLDVERQPTQSDLNELEGHLDLSYEPFHWIIEFPEAVVRDGNGYEVEFDIVVGNPPYGDVLTTTEQRLVAGFKSGDINDIAAQFIERELQILDDGGFIGKILTLKFVYQRRASPVRDIIRSKLVNTNVACFCRRPSQVFEGTQVRTGILTAQKNSEEPESIQTSRFIRFTDNDRDDIFRNMEYESTEGLLLGEKIGSGEDYSLPKVGNGIVRSILSKLKENSDNVIRDEKVEEETDHVVWRSRGVGYWINPLIENLFENGEEPTDFDPIYFPSRLKQLTTFLILQSSLFYMTWMVYGDERHLNWSIIEPFPIPEEDQLEEHAEEIEELADRLWTEMESRFEGGIREMIRNSAQLKPIIDDVDELIGPMYGLSGEEIEYVKNYDARYGRSLSDPNQSEITEIQAE